MQPKGVVFEGKTLDEAVQKGLEALGLSRAEVMINVIEEGSGGFLGLGARPFKVRMMPRPRREVVERPEGGRDRGRERDRSRDGDRARRPGRGEGRGGARREERTEGRPEGRAEVRGERGGEERGRPAPAPAAREGSRGRPQAKEEGRSDRPPADRGRRRGRGRASEEEASGVPETKAVNQVPAPPVPAFVSTPAAVAEPDAPAAESAAMSPEELARAATGITQDLLKAMGFEANVSARAEELSVEVKAEVPKDGDLLAGHKGEVRQALQHLLNRMLNRDQPSRYHLQLEINEFWQHREEELQVLARRLAEEALAEGTEKLTEYLNAQERRIVHVTLRDDPRVQTYGIGDGLIKKVAVAPAEPAEGPKPEA